MKIGIDLGTTNCALAWVDPAEAAEADFTPIHVLEIRQYVAQGREEKRRTLPSFLYLDQQEYVGVYAREQGALVPTKSVYAAKSWLSNAEVDRNAKILPWDAQEAGRIYSPVEASTKYMAHIAQAWKDATGTSISDQDVVLTVPASFDEEARELTVQAARAAGLDKLTLIEEPAAAFYSWIARHLSQSQKNLTDGMNVLIVDVGGGTSDFTLIQVNRSGDHVQFTRSAVGKHLLLGGDNLDLTLSWLVETKLNTQLSLRQRSALRRQCAAAKERLLANDGPESVEITVLGAGSSLIGGTLRTEITRNEARELALDGFLPVCGLDEAPNLDKKSAFRELGLPYVSDPAITKHLAQFLKESGGVRPDAILFNGGFFIPDMLRDRVRDVVSQWFGHTPLVFENQDLDLAVAQGAAYYSHVRGGGEGVLVRGGLPRAYFIGTGEKQSLCLVPRGSEEGSTLELDVPGLQLLANKPVSFRLFSSLTRTEDVAGQAIEVDESFHLHAPLNAVIRFGNPNVERNVPVRLRAHLTEVGTLEIFADSKLSEHSWRLQFELRRQTAQTMVARPQASVPEAALVQACALVRSTFAGTEILPEELPQRLEQVLSLGRSSWPLQAIRKLADVFLECAEGRKASPAHEVRWLNLTGLCLRPGFGASGDDLRIEQARRVFSSGLVFANQIQNEIDWWIFSGRIAGGLNRNQQQDLYQRLSGALIPKGAKGKRLNPSLQREMWRCASSLELLPVGTKTELGNNLLKRIRAKDYSTTDMWCLGRLGARKLLYGPNNLVVPASTVARWIDQVLSLPEAAEAIAILARKTGDSARDLPPATIDLIERAWANHPKQSQLRAILEGEGQDDLAAQGRVFGEELPSGLVIAPPKE
ncbi:hsp70 family protein [Bryobacter aggregatus]|uniref:hsp70 family protein n=1 Tax=Bryobacter aggregatus TaxID=360054 RepID=UPI0004E24F51|nr:hsp70 family protein [Bryobacter aggregatus]